MSTSVSHRIIPPMYLAMNAAVYHTVHGDMTAAAFGAVTCAVFDAVETDVRIPIQQAIREGGG